MCVISGHHLCKSLFGVSLFLLLEIHDWEDIWIGEASLSFAHKCCLCFLHDSLMHILLPLGSQIHVKLEISCKGKGFVRVLCYTESKPTICLGGGGIIGKLLHWYVLFLCIVGENLSCLMGFCCVAWSAISLGQWCGTFLSPSMSAVRAHELQLHRVVFGNRRRGEIDQWDLVGDTIVYKDVKSISNLNHKIMTHTTPQECR